jgi:hypothetical protein
MNITEDNFALERIEDLERLLAQARRDRDAARERAWTAEHRLRPMTDGSGGTCDWGHCDGLSVVERWDAEQGQWLPVCAEHIGDSGEAGE